MSFFDWAFGFWCGVLFTLLVACVPDLKRAVRAWRVRRQDRDPVLRAIREAEGRGRALLTYERNQGRKP
jgi:hypothetical protein